MSDLTGSFRLFRRHCVEELIRDTKSKVRENPCLKLRYCQTLFHCGNMWCGFSGLCIPDGDHCSCNIRRIQVTRGVIASSGWIKALALTCHSHIYSLAFSDLPCSQVHHNFKELYSTFEICNTALGPISHYCVQMNSRSCVHGKAHTTFLMNPRVASGSHCLCGSIVRRVKAWRC